VGSDSDDGNEDQAAARPYVALLRSLTESSGPKAKRRKLDHDEKPEESLGEGETKDVDLVEEPEDDGPEDDLDEDISDDEDAQDGTDPFVTHFSSPDEAGVTARITAITKNDWATKKVASKSSRTVIMAPKIGADGQVPPLAPIRGPSGLSLKPKLKETITSQRPEFGPSEQALAAPLFQYLDTLYCQRTVANGESLRRLVCLHALNHVFKYASLAGQQIQCAPYTTA
jgi:U3 small nucleolar RNA-associated protein 25